MPSQGMPLGGSEEEIEVEEIEEPTDMMEDEDGSVVLNFDEMITEELQTEPDANLAEIMDERVLMDISSELVGYYEDDKSGRQEWEDTYTDGLDLLGVKYETREEPFRGSSGVTHPIIAEAVTQFQAQAYRELLPSSGPVRTQVVGAATPDVEMQAQRVQEFMNYQITHIMDSMIRRWIVCCSISR